MSDLLTQNALTRILSGELVDHPVLQIMAYKLVPQSDEERFRILASDGTRSYQYLMTMSSKIANEIKLGRFEKFTIIRVDNYILNDISNKRVIVIEDATVLKPGTEIGRKIGDPRAIQDSEISETFTRQPLAGVLHRSGLSGTFPPVPKPQQSTSTPPAGSRQAFFNQPAHTSRVSGGIGHSPLSSPLGKSIDKNKVISISTLNPYIGKWVIKARVMSKRDKRTWSNAKGEGTVFSFDVTDDSGEIRITAFRQDCERFYDLIEPNKVYFIANGNVKPSDPRYGLPKADYEITLGPESIIELCHDERNAPQIRYSFKEIKSIQDMPENSYVDILAILKEVGPLDSVIVKRTSSEMAKRDLLLLDNSEHEIRLTLWGTDASNFNIQPNSVIAVKGARVKHFGGFSLTGGVLSPNPESGEAYVLKSWYANQGQHLVPKSLSGTVGGGSGPAPIRFVGELNLKQISEAPEEKMFSGVLGTVLNVTRTSLYKGCKICNRKLDDSGTGFYLCNKCNKETTEFQYRLIATLQISDPSGAIWANIFTGELKDLIKADFDQLLVDAGNDTAEVSSILSRQLNFTEYYFKIRSNAETYNEERRSKHIISSGKPTSHRLINKLLLSQIASMQNH